ncbi:TSUP family transporter [Haliangium sp.]|uniref:TSUP family transporter n=1 Tax=Haliangium sp. TaxID=2663208 RepID=UPI003D1163CE
MTALLVSAAVVALGACVQSAVGFGIGLVGVPLLLWAGRPLPEAVALMLGAAAVQTGYGTYVTRAHIVRRRALTMAPMQWAGITVGVVGMGALTEYGPGTVKQIVSALVLLVILVRIAVRPRPTAALHPAWTAAAAGSSGAMAGLAGMGGPPLVLYAMAHGWPPDAFRGFLWCQFLLAVPALVAALALKFGAEVLLTFGLGVALAPCTWLGARAGLALSSGWTATRRRRLATAMLLAIAVTGLSAPYFGP